MAPRTRAHKKAASPEAVSETPARPAKGRGDAEQGRSRQPAAKPAPSRAPSGRFTKQGDNILEGISNNIEKLIDRMGKLESKVFSEEGPGTSSPKEKKHPGKKCRRPRETPEPTSSETERSESASSEEEAEVQRDHHTSSTRRKKHRSSRCYHNYTSESDSSERRKVSLPGTQRRSSALHLPRRAMGPWRWEAWSGLMQSVAPSTQKAYREAMAKFTKFREDAGYGSGWPVSEEEVIHFMVQQRRARVSTQAMDPACWHRILQQSCRVLRPLSGIQGEEDIKGLEQAGTKAGGRETPTFIQDPLLPHQDPQEDLQFALRS
ncbi:uncharacterized protein [Anolis sagrei]|uniref:uncharacterized protein n=1 Tax=Anolis sagrei TaxID=38937 RepID=UPI00352150AE